MFQLIYQKKLIDKQVLSTNLMNNLSQAHEAEVCQSEHQELFLTVRNSGMGDHPNASHAKVESEQLKMNKRVKNNL